MNVQVVTKFVVTSKKCPLTIFLRKKKKKKKTLHLYLDKVELLVRNLCHFDGVVNLYLLSPFAKV